jgi:small subunit ribosomal protein S1
VEIIVAKHAGFCFGVKRALELVARAAEAHSAEARAAETPSAGTHSTGERAGAVYTLGHLIHNPQEIARLEQQGIRSVDSVDQAAEGVLVLSAHGVDPAVESQALASGLQVIDATCPFVHRAHEDIRTLSKEGYAVVILGDPGHREVAGLAARVGGKAEIVTNAEEARALPFRERRGLVVQTTQRPDALREVAAALTDCCRELRVFNTICEATVKRQESARGLAEKVDVVIVVGGRNSANTARLREICAATGTPTHHIETADELTACWLDGARRVGVTAGASTPAWIIEEVVSRLRALAEEAARP